jgi:hypothetical protein
LGDDDLLDILLEMCYRTTPAMISLSVWPAFLRKWQAEEVQAAKVLQLHIGQQAALGGYASPYHH